MVEEGMKENRSIALYEKAKTLMPGGVSSPVRAFAPHPFFTARAKGCKLHDVDGNEFIDYCMAYGPLILGHGPAEVIQSVKQQLEGGTMYGTPSEREVELVQLITSIVPAAEMVRLVNSGTEATMHAIRLARGYTGRTKLVKFEGCYHGAHDCVLVKAGSGASTFGAPTSLGIPEDAVKNTIIIPYNNIELLQQVIERNRQSIAAVIIEPVIGNAGVILPAEGYLQAVRKITEENQIILIFDEVITGFRLALGGAQEYYGIKPDIVTLGKIMGGGFPMAAYAGRRDLMTLISPLGKVYQAGTLSGNPVSVTAGLTTLQILAEKSGAIYPGLEKGGDEIRKSLQDFIQDAELPAQVHGVASMFQVFFTDQPVVDYASAQSSDKNRYMKFHRLLLEKGVFLPPSQFETCFISTAHRAEDIAKTLEAMGSALKTLTS